MKTRTHSKISLYAAFLPALILFLTLQNACDKVQTGRPVPKRKIPEKTFISILTDLYLTDGLVTIQEVHEKYSDKDSLSAYIDIITSHGYTKENMDLTLEFYFVKRPKRLIRIYDRILGELTEIDTRLSNIPAEDYPPSVNEWKGLSLYAFPDTGGGKDTEFSFIVNIQGFYTLAFTVTIYPFDQSVNPRFTAWLCNADSSDTGKKYFLPSIKYIKDGQPHRYIVNGQNEKNFPVILKGKLYDRENNPAYGERYGRIEKIEFFYSEGK